MAALNVAAMASAIATRFAASTISPPSGYSDVAFATHLLPNAIASLPTALVFPPSGSWQYGPGRRWGDLTFPVRFYVEAAADRPRAAAALYAWQGTLMDQLEGAYDLDLSGQVTHAVITDSSAGTLTYAEQEYVGLEFTVTVHIVQAIAPTT
jgi:hypothetical protein